MSSAGERLDQGLAEERRLAWHEDGNLVCRDTIAHPQGNTVGNGFGLVDTCCMASDIHDAVLTGKRRLFQGRVEPLATGRKSSR